MLKDSSGRSITILLSGAACAIPVVMSARTIPNRKSESLQLRLFL